MAFPTDLDIITTTPAGTATLATGSHTDVHTELKTAIESIEAKVGKNSSAIATSHDYKLSGVTGTDKAVSKTGTETLTNKTLTSPVIQTISNTGTITVPTSTDTLVGRATTDTLTNKTLTSPVINQFGTASGLGTAWPAFTPTFTNLNIAQATIDIARCIQIGKFVSFYLKVSLTGAAISGSVSFTLPVTASSNVPTSLPFGFVRLDDNATGSNTGRIDLTNTTTARILVDSVGGTYGGLAVLSSTVPFTWANLDYIAISASYEAA